MVCFRASRSPIWLVSLLVYFTSTVASSSRNTESEKFPKHDRNWWLWNQEIKEKVGDTRRKEENGIRKLELKRGVHQFKPTLDLRQHLFTNEQLTHHKVPKRWLHGGNKKHQKENKKWLIDSPRIDPINRPKIGANACRNNPPGQRAWHRANVRKQWDRPKKIAWQQKNINSHVEPSPEAGPESILFGNYNYAYNKVDLLNSRSNPSQQITRLSQPQMVTYLRPTPPSAYLPVWNKSRDPVWDRYMTPFEELKFNPLSHPYPFHDPRSSIPWYTTLHHGIVRTSEPPLDGLAVQNEMIENKGIAKSKDKKAKERHNQRLEQSGYEPIPKEYALTKLRKLQKSNNKFNGHYGWGENPIIVPGFKRKLTEAPGYELVSVRPYVINTEENNAPFDGEFIQASRANRNQSKNLVSLNDGKITANGIPIHQPPPYAFPGGVNISILVPNPPVVSSHEASVNSVSTSTEKRVKKKKERKKKVKDEDELHENLLNEPRSFSCANRNSKVEYKGKSESSPLNGYDDRRLYGIQFVNHRPHLNQTIDQMKQPFRELDTNFSLLRHMKNLTLNQLALDDPLSGTQNDQRVTIPLEDNEYEDDEIRVLYDEQRYSSTTRQSNEKQPYDYDRQSVSVSWYRLTDYAQKMTTTPDVRYVEKSTIFPNGRRALLVTSKAGDDLTGRTNSGRLENEQQFIRSIRGSREDNYDKLHYDATPKNILKSRDHDCEAIGGEARDQWYALDEDLKSGSEKGAGVVWQARNRKRETDYDDDHQAKDEQGYYRLSVSGNSIRSPTSLIISALGAKPNKNREREYYDDISDERTREQIRTNNNVAPTTSPKLVKRNPVTISGVTESEEGKLDLHKSWIVNAE